MTSGILRGSFSTGHTGRSPVASASLRAVHLVCEAVPGGAQAVCTVGHSKDTEMQHLMIPQSWRPYSGGGCSVRMLVSLSAVGRLGNMLVWVQVIELRALCMSGKRSTTEQYPLPHFVLVLVGDRDYQ